jgi:hypothetical protein
MNMLVTALSFTDEAPLNQEALDLVEQELDNILSATLKRVRISNQISWAKSMLETRTKINEEVSHDILDELRDLQRKADKMYKKLYSTSDPIYEELPPLDINHTVEISTISVRVSKRQARWTTISRLCIADSTIGRMETPSDLQGRQLFRCTSSFVGRLECVLNHGSRSKRGWGQNVQSYVPRWQQVACHQEFVVEASGLH